MENDLCRGARVLLQTLCCVCICACWLSTSATAAPATSTALPDIPSIAGHLTAPGKQLTNSEKTRIDKDLASIQERSKTDVAIYILPTPLKVDLTVFGERIYKGWNIGKEWKNGGVLLVLSEDGRTCQFIQDENRPPLSAHLVKLLAASITTRPPQQELGQAILSCVTRCDRYLSQVNRPQLQEPLERDVEMARSYATGTMLTLVVAGIGIFFKLGRQP